MASLKLQAILTILMAFCAIGVGFVSAEAPVIVYNENFDSLEPGTFPVDWVVQYSGVSALISSNDSCSSPNSFNLIGKNSGACVVQKPLADIGIENKNEIWFEAMVKPVGSGSLNIGFTDYPYNPAYGQVQFNDGNLYTVSTQSFGSYGPDTWYKVKVYTDLSTYRTTVWINGEKRVTEQTTGMTTGRPDRLHISAGNEETQEVVYYDDIVIGYGNPSTSNNLPPNADFEIKKAYEYPIVGEYLIFDASNSLDPDGSIVSYTWDFGDGSWNSGTSPITTHVYTEEGEYWPTLTVVDNSGLVSEKDIDIYIFDSCYVTDFRPNPNGFQFNNFQYPIINYQFFLSSYPWKDSPADWIYWGLCIKESAAKGTCFGISAASLISYDQNELYPWSLGNDRHAILPSSYSQIMPDHLVTSEDMILHYHMMTNMLEFKNDEGIFGHGINTPDKVYQEIKNRFNSGNWRHNSFIMNLNDAAGNRHSVVPYAYYDSQNHYSVVKIYDPSSPNSETVQLLFKMENGHATSYNWGNMDDRTSIYITTLSKIKDFTSSTVDYGIFSAECPVHISIVDPDGIVYDESTLPSPYGDYYECDVTNDGNVDHVIVAYILKDGDYQISITPNEDALPSDTYSLKVYTNNGICTLAENVPISDLPNTPYIYNKETNQFPVPEFPSIFIPICLLIGFSGILLIIQRIKN